ncbi:uncharacterized protein LOC129328630 [Eublepharis macularius]|uniref:Uncharacterized protein LOC129328630 n=1 Tax=Eublepharis macularius TaxID=481883 RepID=A0AA97KX05_EUBMA|nr:uncharacterized protein LOC129328630 [Eublepharis macularius]
MPFPAMVPAKGRNVNNLIVCGPSGKKEEEIANKECAIVEAVMPSVEGIGNHKPAKKEIWICGNSVISVSKMRAKSTSHWFLLGFPPSTTNVYWYGNPTLMWDDLLPLLHEIYHCRSYPSIILIHLGENDLLIDSRCSLVPRMQNDLGILRRALPDVVIIWSSLLPLHFWTSSEKLQGMESERNNVNCKMAKYCNETGICYLSHKLITAEKKPLFMPDNTLSSAGADIFVRDLVEVLKPYHVCNEF